MLLLSVPFICAFPDCYLKIRVDLNSTQPACQWISSDICVLGLAVFQLLLKKVLTAKYSNI